MNSQPGKQDDLHGSAPDTNETALILIDVINGFEFPGGPQLLDRALPIAFSIRELKERTRKARIPVIYVNDNFGRWQSSFEQILERCLRRGAPGRAFVEQLVPQSDDYFVLKPKHSGFYQTPLDILLKHLGTKRLILTGLCTNSCVLFTGQDAYMRDLELCVPEDCVATFTSKEHENALEQMASVLKANTTPSPALNLHPRAASHEGTLANAIQ